MASTGLELHLPQPLIQVSIVQHGFSPKPSDEDDQNVDIRRASGGPPALLRIPIASARAQRMCDALFKGDNSGRAIRSQAYEHNPREGVKCHAHRDRICAAPRTAEDEATRDRSINDIPRLKDKGATLHTASGSGAQDTAPPTAPLEVSNTRRIGESAGPLNEGSAGRADVLIRDDRGEVPQRTTIGEASWQQNLTGENYNSFNDSHPPAEVNSAPATAIPAHVQPCPPPDTAGIIQNNLLSLEMTRFDLHSMGLDLQPEIFPYTYAREVAETLVGGRYVSFHDPGLSPDERANTRAPWVSLAVSVALDLKTWNRVCIREHCRVCSR